MMWNVIVDCRPKGAPECKNRLMAFTVNCQNADDVEAQWSSQYGDLFEPIDGIHSLMPECCFRSGLLQSWVINPDGMPECMSCGTPSGE